MINRMVDHLLMLLATTRRPSTKAFLLSFLVLTIFFFRGYGNVNCFMLSCIGTGGHHSLKLGIQSSHKAHLLLAVSIDMLRGILRKVVEFSNIFQYGLIPLLQCQELFQLHGHNTFWYIMGMESFSEFSPINPVTSRLCSNQVCPPSTSCTPQLLGGKHWLLVFYTSDKLKLLLHCTQPIIGFQWFICLAEHWRTSISEIHISSFFMIATTMTLWCILILLILLS